MDNAMDQLNNQFQDMSMSFLAPQQDLHAQERAKYVQQKIHPTEKKDIEALQFKIKLTKTEKDHNEALVKENKTPFVPTRLITEQTKLATYIQELEREFDERKSLEANENEILEAYAKKHFKPTVAVKGWIETEENRKKREIEENILARKHFIEANREKVLGAVLRTKIKEDLQHTAKGHLVTPLQNDDKAQQLLSPFYAQRIHELKNELKQIDGDRKKARKSAKEPVAPEKNITNDEPKLPNAITTHYRLQLLANELKKPIVQEIVSAEEKQKRQELIKKNTIRSDEASQNNYRMTEAAVQDSRAKKFTRLV